MEYAIITMNKGNIKTVDSFIKNYNAIGHNMKALSVSAYAFLTDENKEVRKEFKTRVLDELHMSNATLTNLKNAGYLYSLHDFFNEFAYTNIIFFKKLVDRLEEVNDATIEHMFRVVAHSSNSRLADETTQCVEYLASLSQKDLKNVIDKFIDSITVEDTAEETDNTEDTAEDTTEDTVEDVTEDTSEEVEAVFYNIIDDDFADIMNTLTVMINEKKLTKQELVNYAECIYNRLSSYAE